MMDLFENTITLDKKIGVIIPKVEPWLNGIEDGQGCYKRLFASMFSVLFGGATITSDLQGYYYMNNGNLAFDDNIMVYAYYSEMTQGQKEEIAKAIQKMKTDLNQECIGVEYEGKFTMIF